LASQPVVTILLVIKNDEAVALGLGFTIERRPGFVCLGMKFSSGKNIYLTTERAEHTDKRFTGECCIMNHPVTVDVCGEDLVEFKAMVRGG
jgi:hypothetical protein